ncbi:MAG TPA: hypothetical protein VIJ92_04475 [Ginsengibacter sp.]
MKKIFVLFNGISAPWRITTFALNIAKSNSAAIHVLFLKDEVLDYPYPSDIASVQKDYTPKREKADNKKLEEKNIALFKTFCDDEKVVCYFDKDVSLKKLANFSTDADIVITDSHNHFQRYALEDILSGATVPVCLISTNATEIKTNILLYDGTDNAIHAIETYSHLFPNLCDKKSFILIINEGKIIKPPSKSVFQKFTNVRGVSLSGNLEEKLVEFLDGYSKNTTVVTGAFRRSAISWLFKPSLSNIIINQSTTSLFIAHT